MNGKTIAIIAAASLFVVVLAIVAPMLADADLPVEEKVEKTEQDPVSSNKPTVKATVKSTEKNKPELEDEEIEELVMTESEMLIQEFGFDPKRIEALRAARHGDPRAPEIERQQERELPSADELADPELYGKYELRQHKKFIAAYVKASEQKLDELQSFLDENRDGLQEKDAADIEEEIDLLKQMRERMLAENPDVADELSAGTPQ